MPSWPTPKEPKGSITEGRALDYARWILETFSPDEARLRELAAQQF